MPAIVIANWPSSFIWYDLRIIKSQPTEYGDFILQGTALKQGLEGRRPGSATYTVVSGGLNVVKDLKRTNQIVNFGTN